MEAFSSFITSLENWIWGAPMLILLCGTHIFMTLRTGFIQKKTFTGIRLSVTKDPDSPGDVSQFQALTTALASTIGTGNIIGVGTAIYLGGPGAVLWCWLTGVFGIATKYAESLIAVKYRVQTADGRMMGGAMYALERVHRAAHHAAVCGLHAVLDRDQALRVLGRDAEHAGQPAPQHRARAAEIDGRAHADDVARADGGRERGRQRLKLADVARGVRVLRHRQPDAGERLFLDKSGAQRHENMCAAQQDEHRCAPYPVFERGDKARESLHVFLSPLRTEP